MEKLLIPLDKANHIIYGFLIYILSNLFVNEFYSFLIVYIIALSKELIYDGLLEKGTFEIKDIIYTILPGLLLTIKSIL